MDVQEYTVPQLLLHYMLKLLSRPGLLTNLRPLQACEAQTSINYPEMKPKSLCRRQTGQCQPILNLVTVLSCLCGLGKR